MKVQYIKYTLTILCLVLSFNAKAYDFESEGIFYNITSISELTIGVTYGDSKYSGEVVIPETVQYNGKNLKVTSIEYNAFKECNELKSIVISNNITSINQGAFNGCKELKSVMLSNNITLIGKEAFKSCSKLTSLILPNSVTVIDSEAFAYCVQLTSITINNGTNFIGEEAFNGCSNLTSITIPNSVNSIGKMAFWLCNSLKELRIEDGNTLLSLSEGYISSSYNDINGLFTDTGLEKLYIGRSLKYTTEYNYHGLSPFCKNQNLKSVTIGKNVTILGTNLFLNCNNIEELIIADSNTSLTLAYNIDRYSTYREYDLFKDCQLKEIYIGRNLTYTNSDYQYPFQNKLSITTLAIGDNVTSISKAAFSSNSNLISITIGNGVISIDDEAFMNCGKLTSLILPNSITSIGKSAFQRCTGLTSIAIPNNVTSIGDYAFSECTGLISFIMPHIQPLSINENTFSNSTYVNCELHIPINTTQVYQSATGWKNFFKTIEDPAIGNESYLLTVKSNQGGEILFLDQKVNNSTAYRNVKANEKVTFTITPDKGYRIAKVLLNQQDISQEITNNTYTIEQVKANETLEITFEENFFTVTTSYNEEQGTIFINDEKTATAKLQEGKTVIFSIIPLKGYSIDRALLGEEDITTQLTNNTFQIDNLSSDLNLAVTFKLITYNTTVIYNSTEGKIYINGKETESANIKEGEEVTYTIIPNNGYDILKVFLKDKDITSELVNGIYTISQVMADVTLSATFKHIKAETVSLTISCCEGGNLKQEIPVGNFVTYQIFPSKNWEIHTVTFNGTDVTSELINNQYTTPTITENSVLSVVFHESGTGISMSTANTIRVYTSQRNIIIRGASADTPIRIYSASGQMIHSSKSVDDDTTITLAESGIYLIKIENNTYKVNLQ